MMSIECIPINVIDSHKVFYQFIHVKKSFGCLNFSKSYVLNHVTVIT